jgi:hypothetical protein
VLRFLVWAISEAVGAVGCRELVPTATVTGAAAQASAAAPSSKRDGNTVQVFDVQFTDLQRQLLTLLRIQSMSFGRNSRPKFMPICILDMRNVGLEPWTR